MQREATLTKLADFTKNSAVSYRFSQKWSDLATDWNAAAPAGNLFLQGDYLRILEENPPVGMRFVYLVFYKNEQPFGIAFCQIKQFKADENIRDGMVAETPDPCFFDGLFRWMRRRFAGMISADILICGNMLLTGENAFFIDEKVVSQADFIPILEKSLQNVIASLEKKGTKIPAILHKDLFKTNRWPVGEHLVGNGFVEFDIQPNMILNIRPEWGDFEDYVAAMDKKYRTRTRRAFKKKDGLALVEFSASDVLALRDEFYALYRAIAKNAGFNMIDLNPDYLPALKAELGDRCRFFGYFLDQKLVAFYSVIENHEELEAHFLGYDQQVNHDFQVYLNILYDIVRLGIEGKFQKINFARTALEIKSSIGAEPYPMFCYLRLENSFANKFAGRALEFLKPVEVWTPRHPFISDKNNDEQAFHDS